MKVKNINISIKSTKEVLEEFAKTLHKVRENPSKYGKHHKQELSFESVKAFRNVFTEKRMELLHLVKKNSPKSIYELAKIAKRDIKSVKTDIQLLTQLDLISLKELNDARNRVMPIVDFDKIRLEIAI